MIDNFLALKSRLEEKIIGQPDLVDRLLIGILADGHLLIEGMPGLAKTTAVHTLANELCLAFQRIQFTPDMIPGDITGSDIFVPQDGHFQFMQGPIFKEIILADEINRAPPKVQSALLEAMQEQQVTVGGVTRKLPDIFMVIATQNPIEVEGTYPLPEAQIDRFLMKIPVDYPSETDELTILQNHISGLTQKAGKANPGLGKKLSIDDIVTARKAVNSVYIDKMLTQYIVKVVQATRNPGVLDEKLTRWLTRGASPRATLAMAQCARAHAFLRQRDFVEPGDIVDIAHNVLGHRIALHFSAHADGVFQQQVIDRILDIIPVP